MAKKKSSSADVLIKWLHQQGLTTQDFARMSGLSYSAICKWRRGARPKRFIAKVLSEKFPSCSFFA